MIPMTMATPAPGSPTDAARRVIAANDYMTLATADRDGRPWATPVWFAERDGREFVWVSRPGARHSLNIADRPEIALAIFDSTVTPGEGVGVYVEAVAEQVDEVGRADALAVYSARSVARGIREWQESDVAGSAPHRIYRARAMHVWVLDEHDQRVPVE